MSPYPFGFLFIFSFKRSFISFCMCIFLQLNLT